MEQSLYELLGVKENATVEELKSAYRRLAADYHPDKGGDDVKFGQIAYAYRVLKDPGSRLLYDTTGQTEPTNIEKEANGVVRAAFADAVNNNAPRILDHARNFIKQGEKELNTAKANLQKQQAELKLKREKVKVSEGPNHFHQVIDQAIKRAAAGLLEIEDKFKIAARCYEMLNKYEEEVPPPPPTVVWSFGDIFGTGIGKGTETRIQFSYKDPEDVAEFMNHIVKQEQETARIIDLGEPIPLEERLRRFKEKKRREEAEAKGPQTYTEE